MRLAIVAILSILSTASARVTPRQASLDSAPQCVPNCLAVAPYNNGDCDPTDSACLCRNEGTLAAVNGCLADQCPDQLADAQAIALQYCAAVLGGENTSVQVTSTLAQGQTASETAPASTTVELTTSATETTTAGTTTATVVSTTSIDPAAAASSAASSASESAGSQVESASSEAAASASSASESLAASASSVASSVSEAAQTGISSAVAGVSQRISSAASSASSAVAESTGNAAIVHNVAVGSTGFLAGILALVVAL